MDGNCPPPTAAHREAGPDFPSQVFIGRTHPCEPWPPPGLRKRLLQKGRIKCPLLHCRFLSWQEAQEAWPQALETLRDVPSSCLRAAVGTSGAGLVGLQGAEQEGGPRGGGCRRLRSWLLAPGALAEARLQVAGRLCPLRSPNCPGRDAHRPSKWAVICSKVFPLVSGTQSPVNSTPPAQKAEASQKAP